MEVGQGLDRLVQLLLGLVQLLLLGPDIGVQGGGAQGEDVEALYGALDAEVMRLYGLTDVEAETIRTALRGKPSFLR